MKGRVRLSYLVCATPRSGSTLLCEMLRKTGRAGRPLEHFEVLRHSSLPRQPREYFHNAGLDGVLELLAPNERSTPSTEAPEAWWARILAAGSTDNGVWGGKLMWGHVDDLLSRIHELPGLGGANLEVAMQRLLGSPRFVFVTRADKAEQAVSLWRALQTRAWRADASTAAPAAYDFDAIDHLVSLLSGEEQAWAAWFERAGIVPLRVSYDDLDAVPQQTVTGVLDFIGLGDVEAPAPPLARQRDEESLAWVERYRRERAQAA